MDNEDQVHIHNGTVLIGRENRIFWKTNGFLSFLKDNSDTVSLIDNFSFSAMKTLTTVSPDLEGSNQEIHSSKLRCFV